MKTSVFTTLYKLAVASLAMTLMVSCTNAGQSKSGGAAPSAPLKNSGSPATAGQQNLDGTTDGAGGNGIDSKIYESYIVDPQTLPAYRDHLEATMTAVDKKWNEFRDENRADDVQTFATLWKMKKWYIAPVSLFFVTYYSMQRFKQVMGLTYTMICVSVVVSAYAIVQYKLGQVWCYSHIPGIESTSNLAWFTLEGGKAEVGSFRPVSTSSAAGGYAALSAYGLLAGLAVVLLPRMVTYRRVLSFLGLSVMAIAILVSGIRSTLMGTMIATAVVLALNVKSSLENATCLLYRTRSAPTRKTVVFTSSR
ncbi:MAG: hypothetical protein EOP06_32670 [Proteobacteria bacterium]|nr:MAG: hypothetical protein EOP06_32670 [Pseudomonadota bacterium]